MPSYRIQRTNEDILRELTALLREVKDPRVAEAMPTIVKTDTDSDLATCKVYVSSLKGIGAAKEAVAVLRRAGFLRRELGRRLRLRHAPELLFIADDSLEHSAHISELLKTIGQGGDGDVG